MLKALKDGNRRRWTWRALGPQVPRDKRVRGKVGKRRSETVVTREMSGHGGDKQKQPVCSFLHGRWRWGSRKADAARLQPHPTMSAFCLQGPCPCQDDCFSPTEDVVSFITLPKLEFDH